MTGRTPLTLYLWRNGLIHFIVLLLLNLADMVIDVTEVFYADGGPNVAVYNPLPLLISPITSIIISRFTLDLRKLYFEAPNAEISLTISTRLEVQPTTGLGRSDDVPRHRDRL